MYKKKANKIREEKEREKEKEKGKNRHLISQLSLPSITLATFSFRQSNKEKAKVDGKAD